VEINAAFCVIFVLPVPRSECFSLIRFLVKSGIFDDSQIVFVFWPDSHYDYAEFAYVTKLIGNRNIHNVWFLMRLY